MLSGQQRRCAVLGSPIGHSLSPVLHRAAYEALGLGWSYDAVEVDSAGLAAFVDSLGAEWRGLSLTMPLKRTVLPLLTEHDEWVSRSGAANTVILDDNRRIGHNTDVPGAVAALQERGVSADRVTILGAGATAASVGLAVSELGATEIRVAARNAANAADSIAQIAAHPANPRVSLCGLDQVVETELLVSTIPAAAEEEIMVAAADSIFEVVYDPWPTPLAELARDRGCILVDGLDLLSHQAVGQVRLMTGCDVDVEIMRAAGRAALQAR